MYFNSRQLRAFLLVAHHRNFSRAAEALFITPPGLSTLIRELEIQLGFRLFERTTRRVALTDQGRELLDVGRRSLNEFETAVGRIGKRAAHQHRSISLGATPWVAANILPQAIGEFREHRPDVRVDLLEGERSTIIEQVRSGKLDAGLGAFVESAAGIRRTPLFRFSLLAIRGQTDRDFRPASIAWSAFTGAALISLPASNPTQQLINRRLARAGVVFPRTIVLNYLETVIAMVEARQGVAVVPSFVLPACRTRNVVTSRITNPTVNLDFYQISARVKRPPAEAEDFMSFLKPYVVRWAGRAGVS